jgi:predicted GNAT family acetyltransferase
METYAIQNNSQDTRFELLVDGHLAKLDYQVRDGLLQIDYVSVPSAIGGRGIGGMLVRAALEWGQREGLKPHPICGFARAYLEKHPEFRDSSAFTEIVSRQSPAVQELAYRTRSLIYQFFPGVVEVPWVHQGTIGYGVGPKKMSEHFSWLSAHKSHVNLGFFYGSELPDPEHLLEGTGKLLRHVKIRRPEDLENPALHTLLRHAMKHRMPGQEGQAL